MQGACKYCGQIYIVPDGCKDPDKEATLACTCDGAAFMRKLEASIAEGKANVQLICEDEDIKRMLIHAIDLAGAGKLHKLSQTDRNGVKFTITMKNDTTFKIEKTVTKKESIG